MKKSIKKIKEELLENIKILLLTHSKKSYTNCQRLTCELNDRLRHKS